MTGHTKGGQGGISITGLLVVCVILGLTGILAAKIVPEVSEYADILREVRAVAADPAVRGGSVSDIKRAYSKRADIAYIKSITANDLEITKDGEEVVIDFAYDKKIPLFANASLLLEFEGSSVVE